MISGVTMRPVRPVRAKWLWAGAMALTAALYTAARFSGLEYHSGYWGNAFQVLHPGSFAGDPYMERGRPTMLSLYYGAVWLAGERWLDDRFTLVVYVGLVMLALAAVDRMARLFGATGHWERLGVLSIMLVGHSFKDGQGLVVSQADFNPTTLAGPIALWLLALMLSGSAPGPVLGLTALLAMVSVKNAWLPALIALVVLFRERLQPHAKRVVVGLAIGGLAASLAWYYVKLRPAGPTHPLLFDYIVQHMDNSEANPFLDSWGGNVIFLLLMLAGGLLRAPQPAVTRRLRTTAVLGVFVFVLGGAYLSYAPDVLKIPYLVPFDPNRALWWPICVVLVALSARAFSTLQATASVKAKAVAVLTLAVLYLLPFHGRLAGIVLAVGAALAITHRWIGRPGNLLRVASAALACTTVASLLSATIHRLPALRTLISDGIIGDNPSAKWIGINEYIRAHTPRTSSVLALAMRDYPWRPEGLRFDGSLRVRTGRPMPSGHPVAFHFDYDRLRWNQTQSERTLPALTVSWQRHDLGGIEAGLASLGSPDYLVAPASQSDWLRSAVGFSYEMETVLGEYALMRKRLYAFRETGGG